MLTELLGDDPAAIRAHPLVQSLRERGLIAQPEARQEILDSRLRGNDEAGSAGVPTGNFRNLDSRLRGNDEGTNAVAERPLDADGAFRRARLRVEGMWCPSCAWVIERALEQVPGVHAARASFHADRAEVQYDPRQVGPAQMTKAVGALGWRASEIGDYETRERTGRRETLRLVVALLLACNVMMLSYALYGGFFMAGSAETARAIGLLMFLLTTIVLAYGGRPIFQRALQAARRRGFVMETLIALGALSAYGLSVFNLLRGDLHQYFDAAAELIALVLLGKRIEQSIRARAVAGIDEIYELLPRKARRESDGRATYVAVESLAPGDRVRVFAGETIPADGRVVAGDGLADESKLTGETASRAKRPGDEALGGSALVAGEMTIAVVAAGAASSLGRMTTLMEQALAAKNPAERLADRAIAFFVPAIVALAAATATVMLARGAALNDALVRAVTVLAIACPCALGVATPLAKAAAVVRGRRAGILVADPEALAAAAKMTALVLDKTGTATRGDYALASMAVDRATADEALAMALAAEGDSPHRIAVAIRAAAAGRNIFVAAGKTVCVEGRGVRGEFGGRAVAAGSEAFLREEGLAIPDAWPSAAMAAARRGASVVFVGWNGAARARLELGDRPREGMREALAALSRRGVEIHLASGDAPETTERIAAELGLARCSGGLRPDEKVALVRRLQAAGHCVGMAGDGANDAAALAAADVGFATGDALAVAKHAAGIVLLSFSGERLTAALRLAKTAARAMRVNVALAFAYNLVALPLAVSGWVNPIAGATAMLLSSLTVAANSARIARVK